MSCVIYECNACHLVFSKYIPDARCPVCGFVMTTYFDEEYNEVEHESDCEDIESSGE